MSDNNSKKNIRKRRNTTELAAVNEETRLARKPKKPLKKSSPSAEVGHPIAAEPPKKKKKKRKGKKRSIRLLVKIILIVFIIGLMCATAGMGVLASWMADSGELNMNYFDFYPPTKILDRNGNFYQELRSREKRIPVEINKVPEMVQLAFISMEDQRYYSHFGIDIRGTATAVLTVLTSGGSTEGRGGSTISQQLIKMTHLSPDRLIERKAVEWKLSFQLEQQLSKREIMEAYLNKVNMAETWGIQSAANMYFGKDISEISFAQSAILTAIINRPSDLVPYVFKTDKNGQKVISRTTDPDTKKVTVELNPENVDRAIQVLAKMHELGHISDREYSISKNELENNLVELQLPKSSGAYSYYTDEVFNQVVEQLVAAGRHPNREEAEQDLLSGGYTILSCVDPVIQNILEKEANKSANFPSTSSNAKKVTADRRKTDPNAPEYLPQVGGAIIENKTGYVVGIIGGRGVKKGDLEINRATSKFQIGSTTKPITVYAPGFDSKLLTLGTTFDNARLSFNGWTPTNYPNTYSGMTTVRVGIKESINIMAVMGLYRITTDVSKDYAAKFGFVLDERDSGPGALALGGYTYGQTPLALASAYSTFPNEGVRCEPIFFTQVLDANGKPYLEVEQEKIQVISKQAAWITTSALKDVVRSGTASGLSLSGQELGGKTGTTNDILTVLFAGFTREYTGAFWFGYDDMKVKVGRTTYTMRVGTGSSGSRSPTRFWQTVFRAFYKEKKLKNASLPSMPSGISSMSIDRISGKTPTSLTGRSGLGNTIISEYFISGSYPGGKDDMHVEVEVCSVSGRLPGAACASTEKRVFIDKDPKKIYPSGVKSVKGIQGPEAKYAPPSSACTACSAGPPVPPGPNPPVPPGNP